MDVDRTAKIWTDMMEDKIDWKVYHTLNAHKVHGRRKELS